MILLDVHESIYNYVRHNSHIYTSEILVVSTEASISAANSVTYREDEEQLLRSF